MEALDSLGIDSAVAAQTERDVASDKTGQNDFLQMLVAQLQNQDPLNPQDSADFAAQLAQFSTVEQLIGVREGVDTLVANSKLGGPGSNGAGLDPTQLVGRDVVVFGSQIEVNESRDPITLPFRTIEAARDVRVRIVDANGQEVHKQTVLAQSDGQGSVDLLPGDHEYAFDPAEHNLAPGVYAIEFTASSASGEAVKVLPMVEGRVDGAILVGAPSIRIGDRVFLVEDVLEVRLPRGDREPTG